MSRYLFKALDGVSATGPGPTLSFQVPTRFDAKVQATFTGSPTSVVIQPEITINGTDFFGIGPGGITSWPGELHDLSCPIAMGYRINILALDGGTDPTVTLLFAIEETSQP
jgi:hypothetical protein